MSKKWVFLFNELDQAEAYVGGVWDDVRGLLGGKGANLAEMTRIGMPVPPGFIVTTETCNAYLAAGNAFPPGSWEQVLDALHAIEKQTDKKFGDRINPLLVSCRSGAKFSMPGMMDTVLNIGLNDETARGMVLLTNNERFVYDSYRRLIQMFGSVVLGLPDEAFEDVLTEFKAERGAKADTELTAEDLKELTEKFKSVVLRFRGQPFPQDPLEQLRLATEAVFSSWNGKRAIDYRRATNIPDDLGTAVNIVTMVFGNMGNDSGTGVAFTRNPATGERKMYGDYLLNAQGEDVVAGIRNTEPIDHLGEVMPEAYAQFLEITAKLENYFKDMQDVEFTIERGRLWMLQTRNGKRTARAAVRVAVEMANEGLISRDEAIMRVTEEQVDTLLHPQFTEETKKEARKANRLYARGVNASPGAAVGQVFFDADLAEKKHKEEGLKVIMVRPFTKPDDVHGMLAAEGILTSEGGATSHAAVVARQFGVPCVVGASAIRIDLDKRLMETGGVVIHEGDWISLDGGSGEVFTGKMNLTVPSLEEQTDLLTLLEWADEICNRDGMRKGPAGYPTKGLQVWANADYPKDAQRARAYGAKGIGLCRTEHMFFEQERLPSVQRMILAKTSADRKEAVDELLPYQRKDFEGLFEAMDGLPVIIRLIDPPLHEFLPAAEDLRAQITALRLSGEGLASFVLGRGELKESAELDKLLDAVEAMHESNPMMGLRGIRLSIVMPEIVEMQVRAIFEAAANVALKGMTPKPEVMIPLTGHVNELKHIQPRLEEIAHAVMQEKGITFEYKFGTMIEIPRAAVTAAEIASVAEFFSFGTNDLTQMTFGYSRDDAERSFLATYVEKGILPKNPFQTLDRDGVGRLMKVAVEDGRAARPTLEVGICGEHGGDPASIEFCHLIGQNYVSCSPFRVPVARLAAAHSALKHKPN
ncbi:MAG TPA: pyruvate, phosphate dikinase [Anaerolineaceae bacterium]|nr:pyruvate, phosphate dikinase [Anaerolineaceae bacterium]HOU42792.1 pyruvate, phosphate dikinase [Anaerolineaceae bacterium]HPA32276.1 pyruvate, phosphate dikinase [Anaerolineaceae bacterium]HQO97193.1 pyruvate, phosphate dikinase [Anaerolineaceae bacterium]